MNYAYLPLDPYLHQNGVVFASLESLCERSYILFPLLGIINNYDNTFPSLKTLEKHFEKSSTLKILGKSGKFVVIKKINIY